MKNLNFFTDEAGKVVPPENATRMERTVVDANGLVVSRAYFTIEKPAQKREDPPPVWGTRGSES